MKLDACGMEEWWWVEEGPMKKKRARRMHAKNGCR